MQLLYDADCALCTRLALGLGRRYQGRPALVIRPLQSLNLAEIGVDAERAQREIPLVHDDGTVLYGSAAIAAALSAGPRVDRCCGSVMSAPPMRPIARVVYRWVAAHRHRLPGGSASCELPASR